MQFNLIEHLLGLTMLGTEWVLWVLIALSVISVTVMVERIVFYYRMRLNFREFSEHLTNMLAKNDIDGIKQMCFQSSALESQLVLRGLEYHAQGGSAIDKRMSGYIAGERQALDRGLVILGTLGSNAPFIGLFGTVLGIIQAFASLANNPAGGPSVVMASISEALVATAVGLMVAIPAVIAYNFFMRIVKRKLANAESVRKIVVAHYS